MVCLGKFLYLRGSGLATAAFFSGALAFLGIVFLIAQVDC